MLYLIALIGKVERKESTFYLKHGIVFVRNKREAKFQVKAVSVSF